MRRILLTIGGFAVLAGCLFPSFEDLQNNAAASSGAADDDDDTSAKDAGKRSKDSGTSGAGTSGTSGTSSGGTSGIAGTSSGGTSGAPDAAPDTSAPPPAKAIRCNGSTCTTGQICCAPIVGDYECRSAANPSCDANDILECDGAKDCAPGQFCCQGGPGGGASVCSSTPCSGFTYCQADDPCPGGKSCSGGAPGGPDNFKSCQ